MGWRPPKYPPKYGRPKRVPVPSQIWQPAMSKDAYARFADSLVAESFNNWRTRTYDCYQKCCLGIL